MSAVLALDGVRVVRGGHVLLDDMTWHVADGERWIVLGPNGAGKTTLLEVASTYIVPSRGTVTVLGQRVGRVDLRELRTRLGYTSAPLERLMGPRTTGREAVALARHASTVRWRHTYSDAEWARADALLDRMGVSALAERPFATFSEGERRRVQLARTLMAEPELLLLDEPTAGLDLGGRERLLQLLSGLAAAAALRAIVLVTHHVEEIPPGFTHALLTRDARLLAAGPLDQVLNGPALSALFDQELEVECAAGRWTARAPGRGAQPTL